MPFATNGQISTDPVEGALEITHEQYDAALAGMLEGRMVTIDGGFAVIDVPAPEPEPRHPIDPAAAIRADRSARLAATDWTQVADAPVDQAAWAIYRQALRDITEQAGFPGDVIWPVPPIGG